MDDDIDDLLFDAAAFAGRYATGAVPGSDPLEILTGLHLGLTVELLDAVDDDPALLDVVRRHWDNEGVDDTFLDLASRGDDLGRRHTDLLRRCGHDLAAHELLQGLDDVLWLTLSSAPQAMATKGDSVPDTRRWTLRCGPLDCDIAVTALEDSFDVAFVPEVGVPRRIGLAARWEDGTSDRVTVAIVAQRLVKVRFAASGRTLTDIGILLPTSET